MLGARYITIAAALLLWGPAASAQETATGSEPSATFYYDGLEQKVAFRGKLVCLRCDLTESEKAVGRCADEGHRHALLRKDNSVVYPLLPGSAATQKTINSEKLHGSEVTLQGRYYPQSGLVVVDAIAPVLRRPIWGPHGGHDD